MMLTDNMLEKLSESELRNVSGGETISVFETIKLHIDEIVQVLQDNRKS